MTRLLLIHTGGTIGMVPGSEGLEPRAGVLEALAGNIMRDAWPGGALEIVAFDPLIDSADMGPASWNLLLEHIAAAQGHCDGIVITHGTDTLGYSAAALFHAVSGLSHPVVVTGAMRPISGEASDAVQNLRGALIAAKTAAPGVYVYFAGRLMAGDCVVKVSSSALDAFREIGPRHLEIPAHHDGALITKRFAEAQVAILTISPGLSAEALKGALAPLEGAVLRFYGAGTMPSDPALQTVLRQAVERGAILLAVSQCEEGGVRPWEYAAGAALRSVGVIDGADLTPEAALARLYLLISDKEETGRISDGRNEDASDATIGRPPSEDGPGRRHQSSRSSEREQGDDQWLSWKASSIS